MFSTVSDVHCSMACNTEKLESTQVSIIRELVKKCAVEYYATLKNEVDFYILTRRGDQHISFETSQLFI